MVWSPPSCEGAMDLLQYFSIYALALEFPPPTDTQAEHCSCWKIPYFPAQTRTGCIMRAGVGQLPPLLAV